jgi:hypothetical protein
VADGAGWKFPIWFDDEHSGGFIYDTDNYDPGAAASIVIGCLYIYMRNGDSRALSLAQKILEDLRSHRASGEYGGHLYKSDYHYAWMNALVAHAFGLAVVGRSGKEHTYPYTAADEAYFHAMMINFWDMSGDYKPSLLNSDLIPFHDAEDHDIWDYAPNYLFMKEMGSMEGVVLMIHTALDWALYSGSYSWFNVLLKFMFRLGEGTLEDQQIYSISSDFTSSEILTHVAVTYGNYLKDNTLYKESEDADRSDQFGKVHTIINMNYGNPVITENADTAENICSRTLEYFSVPKEKLQVTADLSAARFELNDIIKMVSAFHGYDKDKFYISKRLYDRRKLRVVIDLIRNVNYSPT